MNLIKQKGIYFPIIVLLSWLSLTILSFAFGPYQYKLIKPFVFYSYLVLIHLALFIGYFYGQKKEGYGLRLKFNYYKTIEITIIISIIYVIIKLILTKGGDIRNLHEVFRNTQEVYHYSSFKHSNFFSYLDIFFFPLSVFAITNAIYSNNKLRLPFRMCVYIMILISIGTSIGSATRAGIMEFFVLTFAALLLSIYQNNFVFTTFHKIIAIIIVATSIGGFFFYSNVLIVKRNGVPIINPLTNEPVKENYFLYKVTPQYLIPTINNTSFYLSHSYYQLNKALNMPFKGIGFGLSNSYFIMDNLEQYTGWSWPKEISYGCRLDKDAGMGYGAYWSTFYTWIASDVTFPGTIVIIFFIGFLLSTALNDTLFHLNPFAVTSFCTLFYFIFHFAFNNPLQDGSGLMTCFVIPLLWLVFRKKE
jgi:hypothetical protein